MKISPQTLAGAVALGGALLWVEWPVLRALAERWSGDPHYAHGFLVPAFAAYLLWRRRAILAEAGPSRRHWLGLAGILAGAALRGAGRRYFLPWFDAVSLLPLLAGVATLLGGTRALRWSWPAVAFLVFMVPLPWRVELALGAPLQAVATRASTYALQTLGQPAYAEGNIIHVGRSRIGVVDACNGLGMLMMFFAFAAAAAILARGGWVDRVALVLAAAPIALAVNVVRITTTGLLHRLAGGAAADAFYHHLAGLLMMPMALGALWGLLAVLSRMFVEVGPEESGPSPAWTAAAVSARGGDPRFARPARDRGAAIPERRS